MARKSKSTTPLPTHSEKRNSTTNMPVDALGNTTPANGFNWNIRKPTQGPRGLALKNHFVAMVGEYVGTTLFLLLAFGATNVANIPTTSVTGAVTEGQSGSTAAVANTSNLLYIALGFGFSLAVNAWIFFRVSGGLFNPAVSLGMMLVGAITPLRAALLTFSQILGGMTGAAIVDAITPGTLNIRTQLAAGVSIPRGLFIEMFMTAMLMITILLLAAEKHKATFLAPIGIGLSLFIAELMSVYYTGGSLNPARSFGPCVVLRDFNGYHWIYWLGPALGSVIAAGFYKFIKYLEYETVLGPEDPDATGSTNVRRPPPPSRLPTLPMDMNSTSGGAPAFTGSNLAAAPMFEQQAKAEGPTMAVQGAGLGDLLTHGDPSNAFDLTHHTDHYYNDRFNRIEMLLSQLLTNAPSSSSDTSDHNNARSSMSTLAEEGHVPGGHHKIKSNNGFDRSGDLETGAIGGGNGGVYAMRGPNGEMAGETTVAGAPIGKPLGPPVDGRSSRY